MAVFVLVPGAFSGGRTWSRVTRLLRGEGHTVFAPSLTGLGDRVHLAGPQVDLSTQIRDVAGLIEYEDLQNVVLAGHSYGGIVIAGVADVMPERIAQLVFVDALLPADGESFWSMSGGKPGLPNEGAWLIPGPQQQRGLSPQPRGTFEEGVRITVPLAERPFGRAFIRAGLRPPSTAPSPGKAVDAAAVRTRNHPAWRYFELPCGHAIASEMPRELASILAGLAL